MRDFNPRAFLEHVLLQLRNLGVDMSPACKEANSIERMERNPKPCFKLVLWGHTPDYNGPQPAYRFEGYYYPETRQFFVSGSSPSGDWGQILYPDHPCETPAEFAIRNHGLIDVDMSEITVTIE
ncbi:hypothetical protein [Enterovibrio paralichthyis]|uniref:hypothetical protein n=1 Tax=Enterovibrio paralichthyis TaxID=2853805 RepID=UPI001C45D364|nr:hypothetical protein [Enterovibrio paralichthyis]MBV7300213.1 hypothetical protein [Enterovibrio paralichthyis]